MPGSGRRTGSADLSDTTDESQTQDPPGLRAQIGSVRAAAQGLVSSHIELAKAEAGEIMGEIGRAALFAAVAFGALLLLGFLLPIGIFLFVGDWLFGSIGWGVLHGTLFLVAVALKAVVLALGIPASRLWVALLIAIVLGVALALGLSALGMSGQVAAALGTTVGLIAWPIAVGIAAARTGVDMDKLKARFWPSGTIETTKETIEWVRAQTPLGPKS